VQPDNPYSLQFTPGNLWQSIKIYSTAIFFVPYAGLALVLLPLWFRDRLMYFGLLLAAALIFPLLALRHLAEAYWYVPMIGVAIAFGAVASRMHRWGVVLFFAVWFPVNFLLLREKRRTILADANESRSYTESLAQYAHRQPPVRAVIYQATPPRMRPWGIQGAIHLAFGPTVDAVWFGDARARDTLANVPIAVVSYDPLARDVKGTLRERPELDNYVRLSDEIPNTQLGPGWRYDYASKSWVATQAKIYLFRPAHSHQLEIVTHNPIPQLLVSEDGLALQQVASDDSRALRWRLPAAPSGTKTLLVQASPSGESVAVQSIGYVAP